MVVIDKKGLEAWIGAFENSSRDASVLLDPLDPSTTSVASAEGPDVDVVFCFTDGTEVRDEFVLSEVEDMYGRPLYNLLLSLRP